MGGGVAVAPGEGVDLDPLGRPLRLFVSQDGISTEGTMTRGVAARVESIPGVAESAAVAFNCISPWPWPRRRWLFFAAFLVEIPSAASPALFLS